MDISFDSDFIWNIWYYFIVFGSVIILGIALFVKYLLYSSLRSRLGNGYYSIPDVSKISKWRKYLLYLMIFLSFLMILFTILRAESFFYIFPVLLATGIIYINGKIKFYFWDTYSTFFYSERGFCIYPILNFLSFRLFEWKEVENIKFIGTSSSGKFFIKIKNRKNPFKLACRKKYINKIKDIFIKKNVFSS